MPHRRCSQELRRPLSQAVCRFHPLLAALSCHGEFDSCQLETYGPNLLDEPLKGFIVYPVCSPWKCFGSYKPGHMGITTHSESVQPGISAVLKVTSGLGTLVE